MAELSAEKRQIIRLFQDEKVGFLIPDYQRPYAWGEEECRTLWEDILAFAIPNNEPDKFNDDAEYFLGPIVTFKNDDGKVEIIDGQQRLTTILLMLRVFYAKIESLCTRNEDIVVLFSDLGKCIWMSRSRRDRSNGIPKLESNVICERDSDELNVILKSGEVPKDYKSNYAINYRFIERWSNELSAESIELLLRFSERLLYNCILLSIRAKSQEVALQVFSTLNDRGLPLSDSDVFKAQLYKKYASLGRVKEFTSRWKALEQISRDCLRQRKGTAMDELFLRYMYYERAIQGNASTEKTSLRAFFERNGYELLMKDGVLENLESLAAFWQAVTNQDPDRFSDDVLKKLYILNFAPTNLWTQLMSVYFLHYRSGSDDLLDDYSFSKFLDKVTAFILAYTIVKQNSNSLRTPVYYEFINIVRDRPVTFYRYKMDRKAFVDAFEYYDYFSDSRHITKSMLVWWAFQDIEQPLLPLSLAIGIESILSRREYNEFFVKGNSWSINSIGNKAFIEKDLNISKDDFRFDDKRRYYLGISGAKGKRGEGTKNVELRSLAMTLNEYLENDIVERNDRIRDKFLEFLDRENLLW